MHIPTYAQTPHTYSHQVKKLVNMSLRQPVRLAAHATAAAPEKLRHEVVRLKVCVCCMSVSTCFIHHTSVCVSVCVLHPFLQYKSPCTTPHSKPISIPPHTHLINRVLLPHTRKQFSSPLPLEASPLDALLYFSRLNNVHIGPRYYLGWLGCLLLLSCTGICHKLLGWSHWNGFARCVCVCGCIGGDISVYCGDVSVYCGVHYCVCIVYVLYCIVL